MRRIILDKPGPNVVRKATYALNTSALQQCHHHGDSPGATLMRACLAADRAIRTQGQKTNIETTRITKNPTIFAEPWGNIRTNGPIALGFCKECLAWKDARLISDFGYFSVKEDVPKELADTLGTLHIKFPEPPKAIMFVWVTRETDPAEARHSRLTV